MPSDHTIWDRKSTPNIIIFQVRWTVRGASTAGQIITTMFYCRLMFFIIFNFKPPSPVLIWHELQAAIKEKQKDLSQVNGFLDLAISYFNPSWVLPPDSCSLPRGSSWWFSIIANPSPGKSLHCLALIGPWAPSWPPIGPSISLNSPSWGWSPWLPNASPPTLSSHLALSLFFPRHRLWLSSAAAAGRFLSHPQCVNVDISSSEPS